MTRAAFAMASLMVLGVGCASVPPDRYGVASLEIRGTRAMGAESLERCLATEERPSVDLRLGVVGPGECGSPPFDVERPRVAAWAWFWTEWPLFDAITFEQDLRRIERWYAARGYHGARVAGRQVEPPQAAAEDSLPEGEAEPGCQRLGDDEGCTVDIVVEVEEGEPTLVSEITLVGHEALPAEVRAEVAEAVLLAAGDRFDESTWNATKESIRKVLGGAGYARARVGGVARVDRPARRARLTLEIEPGPPCVFGDVSVEGAEDLPAGPIRDATLIQAGDVYDAEVLAEAQRAVYALGAFSAVVVEPLLSEEGAVVPVRVRVTPAQRTRFGLGAGIQSGVLDLGDALEQVSVPQWDVHLLARFVHRNFLGGLRQLTVEERPRLVVLEPFPGFERPRFGNSLSAELVQPAFVEPRTRLVLSSGYELGPDPFDVFFRHRIDGRVGVERSFFDERLFVSVGPRTSLYFVPEGETTVAGEEPPSDSVVTMLEQLLRLDLRDDPRQPRAGALLQLVLQEAGFFLPSSWDYVRATPEARGYLPLPLHSTLALRFALGVLWMIDADPELDAMSQVLGPRDFRLRGGGATSNRGFLPGRLGDGPEGGRRRWEASAELRVPITELFGTALFADAGDVHRGTSFRFDHPQVSLGWGLRLFTPVGSIRLDMAWRVASLQVLAQTDRRFPGGRETLVDLGLARFPGAVHLTIGEAF